MKKKSRVFQRGAIAHERGNSGMLLELVEQVVGARELAGGVSFWLGIADWMSVFFFFFFSSRRRHTRLTCDWSSDVCSSDLMRAVAVDLVAHPEIAAED